MTQVYSSPSQTGDLAFLSDDGAHRQGSGAPEGKSQPRLAEIFEYIASWALIAVLGWAQFPLGSNRQWSWSLLVLLIAFVWVLWVPAALSQPGRTARQARRLAFPGFLFAICLVWAALQTVPWTPAAYHNPIWAILPQGTGQSAPGAVSMNPFVTASETMKLFAYVCVGFLAYALARRHETARRLFVAIVIIGALYAIYGFALSAASTSQVTLFENTLPPYHRDVTGGFVAKNSFATYTGITLIVSVLLIVDAARHAIVVSRGQRQLLVSVLQFALGTGAIPIVAAFVLFSALIASDSRAGLFAVLCGLLALFVYGVTVAARRGAAVWAVGAGVLTLSAMTIVFLAGGQVMQSRLDSLIETNGPEDLRPVMWHAAERAIADHPWLGTGLGTFHDTYALYADRFDPFIFDRVHNDYLELALGLGIPMAVLWILALASLVLICGLGVLRRRRRRTYALAGVAAGIVVAVHSIFDFSLQMPAVSLLFAVVLGVGLAQSEPTETKRSSEATSNG